MAAIQEDLAELRGDIDHVREGHYELEDRYNSEFERNCILPAEVTRVNSTEPTQRQAAPER